MRALLRIRVAHLLVALRNAVERDQQTFGFAFGVPQLADARGQRVDVARMTMVVAHEERLGEIHPGVEDARHGVEARGCRGRRVLREHGQHDDALAMQVAELFESAAHRWIAVAHPDAHVHVGFRTVPQRRFQRLCLAQHDVE